MRALLQSQTFRFLLLGGLAAAINWLSRIPLSLVLPLGAAVTIAYAIGMSAGFWLYRTYVFPGSTRSTSHQIAIFLLVNFAGALVVLGATFGLLSMQRNLPIALPIREAIAHGFAIGIGAVFNFFGHKFLTFRIAHRLPQPSPVHGRSRQHDLAASAPPRSGSDTRIRKTATLG